jgi:hypothetical protein
MRQDEEPMKQIRRIVFNGEGIEAGDASILLAEYDRVQNEYKQLLAVVRDAAEEAGVKGRMTQLEEEVTRLQTVVVQLRQMLDWDITHPDYRYTSLME